MPSRTNKRRKARSKAEAPVVDPAERVGSSIDHGEELSHNIDARLVAEYGSIEKARASIVADPRFEEMFKTWLGILNREPEAENEFELLKRLQDQLLPKIADVKTWTKLAARDRKEFRKELKAVFRECEKNIVSQCRIKPHRPTKETQNLLIWEIKTSRPNASFGQVAMEYNRRTGEKINANTAERAYKRSKPHFDSVFDIVSATYLLAKEQDLLDPL